LPLAAEEQALAVTAPLGELQKELTRRLQPQSETAALEAQVLLAHVLRRPRAWVLAHPETCLTAEQGEQLRQALQRLAQGDAFPYVLGRWEFFERSWLVTPDTLIPRPETELLVEEALHWLQAHPRRRLALDVGTGSGCIAVSLAQRIADLHVVAVDLAWGALQVAQENARLAGVGRRVHLVQADLLPPGRAQFSLVCANLPYIPTAELESLAVARREPRLALDGGPDGLGLIRRLLERLPARLAGPALVLLEIDARQGPAVQELAQRLFRRAAVQVLPDLAGLPRLVWISLAEAG